VRRPRASHDKNVTTPPTSVPPRTKTSTVD
jgi:hypothetical protein